MIGEILKNGRPKVILIASYSNKVFMGVNTWSWYIPTITSYCSIFSKIVSAAYGPNVLYFNLIKDFIVGLIIFRLH